MMFSGNHNVKLLEAVDELGNSLTSTASDDERTFGPAGMAVGLMMDGPVGNLTIHLAGPSHRASSSRRCAARSIPP